MRQPNQPGANSCDTNLAARRAATRGGSLQLTLQLHVGL